jgi:WD40 repeat protein
MMAKINPTDGKLVVSRYSSGINVEGDGRTWQPGVISRGMKFDFSPDHKHVLASGMDGVDIWRYPAGAHVGSISTKGEYISTAALDPSGSMLITASEGGAVTLYRFSGLEKVAEVKVDGQALSAGWSPDGQSVIASSSAGYARLWDKSLSRVITDLGPHEGSVYRARFSPDGKKVVTASQDRTAAIWNATTGKLIYRLVLRTG